LGERVQQVPAGKHLHSTAPNAFGVWKLPAANSKSSASLRQGCKLLKHWEGREGPSAGKGYLKTIASLKPRHTLGVGSQKCEVSVRAQKEFKEGEIKIPIF